MNPKVFLIILMVFFLIKTDVFSQNATAKLDSRNSIKVGKNISIQSQFKGLPLVEPHISAHPTNNNFLLAAAMVVTDKNRPYQSCRLSSFISKDGGLTWTETAHDWWGYDPWTAISEKGQAVMAWLGTPGSFKGQFPVQFFTSPDGGENWDAQVQTLEGGHDGTKISVLKDDYYFTTVRFRNDMGADVMLFHKRGKGNFQEVAKIDGKGQRLNFCEPAILSDGSVIVPASHFLRKAWVQVFDPKSSKLSEQQMLTIRPGGAGGYMRMVADVNMNSSFKDRIYFVRALGRRGVHEGIWLNYSNDKGKNWTKDTRVDLFEGSKPTKAIVSSIAVNKEGVVGISWVDAQHDPEQKKKDVYFTISLDGGESFQRPVRVSDTSTNPKTEGNGDVANKFPGGGHYLGITTKADGSFQLIWSDSRSGIFELQTCNVELK